MNEITAKTQEDELDALLKDAASKQAAATGISEDAALLLLKGRGKEAVIQFLEATPLEEWMYLCILWEASQLATREAE